MRSEWLRYVKRIADSFPDVSIKQHLYKECMEYMLAGNDEEMVDLFNLAAILFIQRYGKIPYDKLLDKLEKRKEKYGV